MKPYARTIAVGVACFALGLAVQRLFDARRLANSQAAQVTKPSPERSPTPDTSGVDLMAPKVAEGPLDLTGIPYWAYGFDAPPKPDDKLIPVAPTGRILLPNQSSEEQTKLRRIDGSDAEYSLLDIRDGQNVVDWFPGDHPRMPDVVAHGPARLGKLTRGCAQCHLPNGKGRPENAAPVALPMEYFLRQISDFRLGLRRSADPRKPNTLTMIELAKAATDQEIKEAAEYFGSIPWTLRIRVVETNLVPKTRIENGLYIATEKAKTEPIAGRIIEVPEDEEQSELHRNPRAGFIAYVPVGSIKKGQDLVTTGGAKIIGGKIVQGRTTPCGTCHGPDLMGVADVPPIAGRAATHTVRQIYDMQRGARNGKSAQLMKLVIANLTVEDIVNIAAYVASRVPPGAPASGKQITTVAQH